MILPKTILVPTDFGEAAEHALDYAVTLGIRLGARVVLLHVLRPPVLGVLEVGSVVTEGAADSVLTAARLELERRAGCSAAVVETVVRTGFPHDVILQTAAQADADLIVMGTHGRRGIRRLFLGSVAEAVVRDAQCPVLTMHSAVSTAA